MSQPPNYELPPTPRQLAVLVAYLEHESIEGAAAATGLKHGYARQVLSNLYHRLGVQSALGAMKVLGWVHPPS